MIPDWNLLERDFPAAAVAYIRHLYEQPGSFSVTAHDGAKDTGASEANIRKLLERLSDAGALERRTYISCGNCTKNLDGMPDEDECPFCHAAFVDVPRSTEVRYQLDREPPRDVSWVLVLHGMNTSGTWQEELSWLIGRSYRRMVPVAIYKYGVIRPGVLFRFRQRQIMRSVIARFVTMANEAKDAGYDAPPDVIAHSFGTWLIAEVLSHDQRIKLGRLVLLGAIVRPDFDWAAIVERGQVESVLNHGAARDGWARAAQFAIPNSGPGGVRGFQLPVRNVLTSDLGHSDYFAPNERMRGLFSTVWRPFLAWQSPPKLPGEVEARSWRQAPALVRVTTWLLVIGLVLLAGVIAIAVEALGLWQLVKLLVA